MKYKRSPLPISLMSCLALAFAAQGIDLGDPAPDLKIQHWVKGKAVNLKESKGGVQVVEFWATWCPPCRASIPHLSELQAKFKDKNVTIIGISDEDLPTVEPFVKRMGDTMEYTVAIDQDRATSAAYMGAFGVGGIPHAFVVDPKGNLAWHGHPMAGLDKVVEQVLAGTFDLAAAKRAANAEKLLPEYFGIVATGKTTPEADKMGQQIVEDSGDNPDLLNQFAWIILTNPRVEYRDLNLAKKAAKKAYDATEQNDASIADTYARALFDTGEIDQAIKVQKRAIKVCTDNELKPGLEETLQRYEKAQKK